MQFAKVLVALAAGAAAFGPGRLKVSRSSSARTPARRQARRRQLPHPHRRRRSSGTSASPSPRRPRSRYANRASRRSLGCLAAGSGRPHLRGRPRRFPLILNDGERLREAASVASRAIWTRNATTTNKHEDGRTRAVSWKRRALGVVGEPAPGRPCRSGRAPVGGGRDALDPRSAPPCARPCDADRAPRERSRRATTPRARLDPTPRAASKTPGPARPDRRGAGQAASAWSSPTTAPRRRLLASAWSARRHGVSPARHQPSAGGGARLAIQGRVRALPTAWLCSSRAPSRQALWDGLDTLGSVAGRPALVAEGGALVADVDVNGGAPSVAVGVSGLPRQQSSPRRPELVDRPSRPAPSSQRSAAVAFDDRVAMRPQARQRASASRRPSAR